MLYMNGFGYVWENQHVENENEFLTSFTRRLKDQFLQIGLKTLKIPLSWCCINNSNLASAMSITYVVYEWIWICMGKSACRK